MKPKEYIKKYGIEKGWNSKNQNDFLNDLTSEFLAFLELNKAEDNIRGFDNAVKVIRMKWDAISSKIPYGLPDKLWSYFWATTVCKLREEFCPREMARRREEAEERRREWERRNAWKRAQDEMFDEWARQAWYERIAILLLALNSVPTESFQYLGLSEDATAEEIKKKYREMSIKMHPDMGGNQEDFIKLTEHKNRCLKWVMQKTL